MEDLALARIIKNYNEIIGHKNVVSWIQSKVKQDSVPNIIIFHGNPGLGKSTLAKLLAVDVTTMYEEENVRQEYIKAVIEENQSTDSIKIFNMSEIQEKEEEIQKVKAELCLGFSRTKRKVLILDEAHNISKKAQDAILTDIEHLQLGIYVFICTTEIGALRDALISRSKATIQLSDLTEIEFKQLIKEEIKVRKLTFDMSIELVIAFISIWANNQPRKALNLLENFEIGTQVSSKELEVFINTQNTSNIIELIKYLYGSMPLGLDYIDSLRIDHSFIEMLLEITKVALGGKSTCISADDILYIREFIHDKNIDNLLKFTVEVTSLDILLKRRIKAAFIRCNINYKNTTLISSNIEAFKQQDLQALAENVINTELFTYTPEETRVETLEELFAGTDIVR